MNENYKKIISNRKIRLKILSFAKFISSKSILKLQYKLKLNRKLNLKEPKRFTEKIQKYKLDYKNPLLHTCVDKLEVRKYIEKKNLDFILVDLYGAYRSFEDIEFDNLPNEFVIKTTNGSQTNIIVKNKKSLDYSDVKNKLNEWLMRDQYIYGREWAYKGLEPKIIIEELLVDNENLDEEIKDYKFLCFNGQPKYIVYDSDRFSGHKRNIYDLEWNNLDIETDCKRIEESVPKPRRLEDMINIAKKLSSDFPFVRVDLYYVNEKIYFGELTFYPWSGYVQFYPDEFDIKLGEKFKLPH
ncbi:ATP-grasp fold amidoligase family protein [Vagococcus lutrae]|uniref:ATP-grasp fold amidoligase family protein n=1 Tax=Vagococcus lutrae TaxID=81947 RepID=UPI00288FBA97|nr:ATP-grasp fold amidoligase family protein [Vagococcus lutrae]MDT2808516.1 ATP-grasp fold amidoligase family protein [Vagococcus lutrae]